VNDVVVVDAGGVGFAGCGCSPAATGFLADRERNTN